MEMISLFRRGWDRYQLFCCSLIFLIVGLVLFSPIFHFQFLSDDWDLVYHADRYESFLDRFTQNDHQTNEGFSYRPMVGIYLTVLKSFFGLNPTGYHVFFVLLHILNAVLVMMLARTLVGRWEGEHVGRCLSRIPFIAGFLFLILPSHVEAVAWVAAGVDVVATCFYLTSLLVFFHFLDSKKHFHYGLSIVLLTLGILTKEIVITLPIVAVIVMLFWQPSHKSNDITMHDRAYLSHSLLTTIKVLIPYFVVVGGYALFRYQATGTLIGYYGRSSVGIDHLHWIRMASDLLSSFVSWGTLRFRIADMFYHNVHWLVVVFALVVLYVKKFHREKLINIFFICSLFLLSLLPVLPLGFNPLSDEGERYGYLPSVFFVILCVFVLTILIHHERKRFSNIVYVGISLICLVYFGYGLHQKLSLWRQHQDSNYQILNQLYEINDSPRWRLGEAGGRKIIVVGLPDSYQGVQEFRNGIEEAYRLYYGEEIDIVRIPVYTIDGGEVGYAFQTTHYPLGTTHFSGADGFDATIPNQLFLKTKDKSLRLTGEKEYSDAYIDVRFFRWHYNSNRSDGVTMVLSDDFAQEIDRETIRLLIYNGSYLVDPLL